MLYLDVAATCCLTLVAATACMARQPGSDGEPNDKSPPAFRAVAVRYQVKDVDASVAFYTDELGFKLDQKAGAAFAKVSSGNFVLWLSGPESSGSRPMPDGRKQEPGGWNRLALEIDDLTARVAAMKKAGLRFRNEIESGPGGKQIQLEDPDGNPVELFEPASPTFEQIKLKQMVGTWSAIVQPAGGPQSKGTMTVKLDLGGHWLVSHFKSDDGGFAGQRIDSYDPQSKKCYAVWADSMSTTPLEMSGNYERDKLVMVGEFRGPDGNMQKMKFITEMTDKNHMAFTEYNFSPDGKEVAIMTIAYERVE